MLLLLIEDDADLRENLSDYFSKNGVISLQAENGKMAFDILKTNKVDIILSDYQMPILNGMDFLKKVHSSLEKYPPIYIMSGYSNYNANDFINAGAAGYFEKPLAINFFNDILKKYDSLK